MGADLEKAGATGKGTMEKTEAQREAAMGMDGGVLGAGGVCACEEVEEEANAVGAVVTERYESMEMVQAIGSWMGYGAADVSIRRT